MRTYPSHAILGPSTLDDSGEGPGVPNGVDVDVNYQRRDSLGPSYSDLAVCAYYNYGDIETWCEGSATHVC